MRVDIDKPGRNHASGGVDFLCATLCQITHRDDTVPDNTDVHDFPGSACAIYHYAAGNLEIKHSHYSCLGGPILLPTVASATGLVRLSAELHQNVIHFLQ